MHWNSDIIVETVFQAKTTAQYKELQGPDKEAG